MNDHRNRPLHVRIEDWRTFDVALMWGHDVDNVIVSDDEQLSGVCNYCGLTIRQDEEPTNCVHKLAIMVHED